MENIVFRFSKKLYYRYIIENIVENIIIIDQSESIDMNSLENLIMVDYRKISIQLICTTSCHTHKSLSYSFLDIYNNMICYNVL